jgi:glycerate 2-kinase
MATTAVRLLRAAGSRPAGGLVVGPGEISGRDLFLEYVRGDHPTPGSGSYAAAEALENTAALVGAEDEVWVLLSGGTTSLIAAPEPGVTPAELSSIYSLLLGSGLDITEMNRIRKRFSRWGGGKLAKALAPALVRVYVVSDVIGDDLASIASGPCVPDPSSAGEIRQLLESAALWRRLPESARQLVITVEQGTRPETPKPGDPAFARVTLEVIASNRLALEAAGKRARELGVTPILDESPLAGEASSVGARLAASLLESCAAQSKPLCWIWGGETTVTLGNESPGMGGRCQELALAAAQVLSGRAAGVTLMAAGTDGRDGPTDAAGAIIDTQTWQAAIKAGRDPARDLESHNSYAALDAAGALLRPGLTGTNVMDVVIGLGC